MDPRPAYLDCAATVPMRPAAVEAMQPFLADVFGNPSGGHAVARAAKTALEEAREHVAACLGCGPGEVVLTGGGTEADNLAVLGAARAGREAGDGDAVVVSAFEHKGVLAPAERLAGEGFRVAHAPVGRDGIVDLDALGDRLDERTALVSVMLVNNEVGTVQPLREIAALVRERAPRARLHTDAVQGAPWLDVAALARPADLVSVSAHKLGGPKGTGALVVREGVVVEPLLVGGGQERGLRSGTSNVVGVAGFAAALDETVMERAVEVARARSLVERLRAGLLEACPDATENGDVRRKVSGNLHLTFPGVEAEALLLVLDREGVCAAAGSSCSSGAAEPSHVLAAMGRSREAALASVRFSVGWCTTVEEIDRALEVVPRCVAQMRRSAA